MEPLLTVNEAAEILNARKVQIYAWITEGILPAVRIGRRIRISPQELRNFINSGGKSYDGPGGWRKEV